MNWYSGVWKPLLFQLDAEQAHFVSVELLNWMSKSQPGSLILKTIFPVPKLPNLSRDLAGLHFCNPVGLAAGFDKNAELVDAMAILGFGFVEIGTVTPKPQKGNPRPRLFRLIDDEAIINRMGFNNDGVEMVAHRLANRKNRELIVGGNIGKNKATPNEEAVRDYLFCFQRLADHVDYFTINLSSPNTPGLRQLLERQYLHSILEPLQNMNQKLGKPRPLFLKIAPDFADGQLEEIVEVCVDLKMSGIVATNTTISRTGLGTNPEKVNSLGLGGLSGKPLSSKSVEVLKILKKHSRGQLTIISTGGIMTEEDAKTRFSDGADAIQLYSGLIFQGPGLVNRILKAI